jgi:membrane carboxypeptidase/penicillin-binding protein
MTVRLASTIGMPRIIDLAKKMGVTPTPCSPTFGLAGGRGDHPLQV